MAILTTCNVCEAVIEEGRECPYGFTGYYHGRDFSHFSLEHIRKKQETAWYDAGYKRTQIMTMFDRWPMSLGYRPYKWTVGYPPVLPAPART